MAGRLEGKVALVTGAAGGIGAGIAERFVREGARVVLTDLQEELGAQTAARLGDAARFAKADVTVEEDVAAAVDLACSHFGALDVMVNNAGIVGVAGRIADTPVGAWDSTIAVLLRGVFLGMKHAARVMVPRRSGSIVSISSVAGVMGGLGPHAYTAAKHGVVGLTTSVATELAGHSVRVNAVAPGNTVTPMTAEVMAERRDALTEAAKEIAARSALGIAGMPEDIAAAVLYLASEEARYVSGHTLVVDGCQILGTAAIDFHNQDPN